MGALARAAAWIAARMPDRLRGWMYRLGPLTRGLRGLLGSAVPDGPTEVAVAAGLLKGARFELDLKTEKDLWLGTYELDLQALLPSLIRPGMTVFDVGANLGYLSVGFARLVGESGRVVAFEPLPDNLRRLRRTVAANGLGHRVLVVPAAVGAGPGVSRFHVHDSGGMGKLAGSAGREAAYASTIEVQVVALDAWCHASAVPAPDWLKVDVEGGEADVLSGARRLLREVRPGWILELHGPEAARRCLETLRSVDYRVHRARPDLAQVSFSGALDWKVHVVGVPEEGNLLEGLR